MTVSDSLFARLAIQGFSQTGARISAVQERIASGVNDPRVSADPARAVELSALRDMRALNETRQGLAARASDRLALSDQALSGLSDNLRQIKEITLRAANDTMTPEGHAALRTEALAIRDAVFALANERDATGRPLFAGSAPGPAYAQGPAGIVYQGDDAASVTQLDDQARFATSVSGSSVFGRGDVFGMIDRVIAALGEPMLSARAAVTAESDGVLGLTRSRAGDPVEVTLTGPRGAVNLRLDLRLDAPEAPMRAINDLTPFTGIVADMLPDGKLRLRAEGNISVSGLQGASHSEPLVSFGQTGATSHTLRPADLNINTLIADSGRAGDHVATMRAQVGSLADAVGNNADSLAQRRLTLDQAVAGLHDIDIAQTVTRLQSLLLTQQASQQSFVKIMGQSLFNYIR
jgi:flagellar hook-associated protein 3 FlgL